MMGDDAGVGRVDRLADRGAEVYFDCPRSLAPLLGSLRTNPTLLPEPGGDTPTADFYVPLLSIPAILGTNLDSIPAERGYLRASPEARSAWSKRLETLGVVELPPMATPIFREQMT